jgi:hypothetical protein
MRDRNARLAQHAQHLQAQAQQLQAQTQQIQVQNQQNQLHHGASQMQSSTNVHVQMQASNHIPTQQIQSHIQVQTQQLQNQHIHPHQPQVSGLSNSVVSPPPVTNNTSLSNSSINSLSGATPANIMNGAVVAPSVAGSSSVIPNVMNSVSSGGVGVSSVASQNAVSNGSASSLTSVCFCFIYICSATWILHALNLHFPLFCVCCYQSCQTSMKKVLYFPEIYVLCALYPLLDYAFNVSINWLVPVIFKYFQLESVDPGGHAV